MKRSARPPVIRLMTVTEAAIELEMIPSEIDHLVDTGGLPALNVSAHRGRRLWPADVQAWATARADTSASIDAGDGLMSTSVIGPLTTATSPSNVPPTAPPPATAAVPSDESEVADTRPAGPPRRARTASVPQHPRWPRYEATSERPSSNYLAFRDAEHVTSYLRARATLELDPSRSVHHEPGRGTPDVVPA